MLSDSRVRLRWPALLPRALFVYASLTAVLASDYGVPIEIKLWDTGRTPLAHMVDVTNGFGLKVLAEHNFLNDNNIAFSPYGLLGIMVALYEGVDGESSYQIQRGMQLPWNRNVMRIGFRDIHRTLKTYFVPEEGFLAGLALNNENVTFNDSYKKILRFYGFDLENDQLPTLPPMNGTNDTSPTATTINSLGDSSNATTATATTEQKPREDTSTTPMREETTSTTNPNAETISDVDIRGPTTTTASPSSAPNAISTTNPDQPNTAEQAEETTPMQTTLLTTTSITTMPSTTDPDSTTANSIDAESEMSTVPVASIETSTASTTIETSATATTETILSTPRTSTAESTIDNEVDTTSELVTNALDITADSTVAPTTITDASTATMSVMTTTSLVPSTAEPLTTVTTDMSTASQSTSTETSTLETLQRRKKSIVDFIFANPPAYADDYLFYRSYDIGPELSDANFDGDKIFLANGLRNIQVTYMHYDSVLEHAYLPHLEASALRLPLDSERYYLLVVLPNRRGVPELGRLLARMARESDLSDVYAALRPRRVRAIVPSFTVKGHITLTTDLQKLGIRDVFEPRQRDFSPMTTQSGVYVRSIEQAVSVAIRKYRPDDHKKNRYVSSRPVSFSATYPFLYFVMDASIHVALMAGKMVDPLNTRIL